MSGPVLWGVAPIGTEGLMSLVTRTVARNLLPSSHVLLRQVGAAHANNPTAALIPGLDEHRLAGLLRQPVAEIARRRYRPLPEPGLVSFFGVAVRADEILFRTRRFAPAALGASPHARALWSLKIVPCCTEHWQYLIDACVCGAVQRWQSADRLDRCDVCNARLSSAPADEVAPAIRDGLGFVIGLLDPDEDRRAASRAMLPPALKDWEGGMVVELALALMPLTLGGHEPRRRELPAGSTIVAYSTSLAQAADLVRGWPDTLIPLLERAVVARSLSRPNVRYTGIADHIPALASEMLPQLVRNEIRTVLAPITAPTGRTPAGQIGMMEAATLLGRPLRILVPARRDKQLETRICLRSNRLMPTLDRAEIEHIGDFSKNRISGEQASDAYDLPSYAISQLADEGLLMPETHPFLVSRYGGDPQLHRSEYERFKTAVQGAATEEPSILDTAAFPATEEPEFGVRAPLDRVTLQRASRAMGGGLKSWGIIFRRMILDRSSPESIPFAISADRIGRIYIGKAHAVALTNMDLVNVGRPWLPPTCSQRDALEILNLPAKHADLLRTFADADDEWEMDWDAVLRLARERITLAEMCARTGLHSNKLKKRLEDAGCPQPDRFGWWRDEALALLGNVAAGR